MDGKKSLIKKSHKADTALIILDMLNLFNFEEGEQLLVKAREISKSIASLKKRCKKAKVPVIYVNDNFGQWRSDWKMLYEKCSEKKCKSADIAIKLKPDKDDYFVLKPLHSGFFHTPLQLLLEELGIKKLILTGVAGNICVLFTAHDAHMRNFEILIPEDCIASNTEADNNYALHQFQNVLGFNTAPANQIIIPH